ncbi:MAG: 1-deoxy-D-xylulose-5-phosphate synthase [Acidobacteriota bacterium]|jgi:1-deoxy-D-xylulose-5-phosphate synthase|nr:1-deoxy-D-xylulose-5-phosphate synthase [Acidobacteriota bacterium]
MSLLERICGPEDLKSMDLEEVAALAAEIRELLINVVSKSGGHLASNLGVVELTLALHRVFRVPEDRIIWDVGHQCYTHKIVTGRRDRIESIRKKDGICGYPDIFESEFDALNTGHASTSLAFASGMALARSRQKKDYHVVAVIGDGALTGGVALEALNHIGQIKPRLIIVLNDNKMSISPNVGGISKHLNYLVSGRPYIRLKELVQAILKNIPGIGKPMVELARKIEVLIRTMMVPGSLFDELGVKYIGPINGHNQAELEKELNEAKKYDFPVLLHVVSEKGHGYQPAEENPSSFHSSLPFEVANGKFLKSHTPPSYSTVFGQTVLKIMREDPDVLAITAAMPEGTGLNLAQQEFPDRVYDVGIAEQYMFDMAGGLSLAGLKPIIGVYSTFLQRAVDQVTHDLSLMKIPVVVGIDRAGLVSGDGPTHQGIYDIALLHPVPNVVLAAPRDENEMQHLIHSAFTYACPVFIRYPKEPGRGVEMETQFRDILPGKCETLRPGRDLLFLGVGPLVYHALEAAERLSATAGIEATVVDVRFIKPLDKEAILNHLRDHKYVITLEDGVINGGFAGLIRELILANGLKDLNLLSLGVPEVIVPTASRSELLARYQLDADGVERSARRLMGL